MSRKIQFSGPWLETRREGPTWHAIVDGVRVTGTFGELKALVETGRKARAKAQRKAVQS